MINIMLFGFLIGLRHALEADHVMAVASLTAEKSTANAVRQGAVWGIGHTLTLLIVGGFVLYADGLIPENVANLLELMVGFMLLILGGDLIRRVIVNKWHIHTHEHADGRRHIHLHSHADMANQDTASHDHLHQREFPLRALLVGLMHGLAGSAALVLLVLQTVQSPQIGVIYIIIFGLGSIVGMALLSVCITVPLNRSTHKISWLRTAISYAIGIFTLTLGAHTIYDIGLVNGALFG